MTEYAAVLRLCGSAVTAMLCVLLLRRTDGGTGMGQLTETVSAWLLTAAALAFVFPVLVRVRQLCVPYLPDETVSVLWRGAAAGLTVELTASLIRDAGEAALADRLELCGRGLLLLIGFPLLEKLLALSQALLTGG